MTETPIERGLIVFFRLTIGWTFLYAGIHHFGDWGFVGGFLGKTKTFQTSTRRSPRRRSCRCSRSWWNTATC